MFTPSELDGLVHNCPKALESLLREVGLVMTEKIEDLDVYSQLDAELSQKFCETLKCAQPIEGLCHLLDLAKIPYRYSETSRELTDKIVANADQIRMAATAHRLSK